MNIVSVNCSMGRTVNFNGGSLETGIFKVPVAGPVPVGKTNLQGDRQSDLEVHGGVDKAVYSYSMADLEWWRRELGREDLQPGAFGENLTTDGLDEKTVYLGDVLRVGTAVLQAVQPRLPCYKLGIKFGDQMMPKRFMRAARWGIYFRVLEEGFVEAGSPIEFMDRDPQRVSINDLASLVTHADGKEDLVRRALAVSSLNRNWRAMLEEAIGREELA